MSASDWTPEREARLKVLWLEGLSGSQIAKQLGITRNAVIAKRHRLGLVAREQPTKRLRTVRAAKPAQKINPFARLKVEPITARGAPKVGPRSVRHMDRFKYQCAMFCEGQEGATGFVCGEPTDGASAWCKSCDRIVYTPTPVKARAA